MTEFDGRCPGCRSQYSEANFRIKQLDPDELKRQRKDRVEKKRLALQQRQQVQGASNPLVSKQGYAQQNGVPQHIERQSSTGSTKQQAGILNGNSNVVTAIMS